VIPVHFDMETQDPDDVMTLAVLATHPRAKLVGVTLTPGGKDQVGLVNHVLDLLCPPNRYIPVGVADIHRTRPSVSGFHHKWLGKHSLDPCNTADYVLEHVARYNPHASLLTGGPLKNPGAYLMGPRDRPFFATWVGQGGFAGNSVVPPEHRLPKFEGKETCATFNLGGDVRGAEAMLRDSRIESRTLVSKNVCHGVSWDHAFHDRIMSLPKRSAGLDLVARGMSLYLKENPAGKKLHDLLALAALLDPSVFGFADVEVYRNRGEWGSRLWAGPGAAPARISVSVDREKFFSVLTEST
jgi:inosine-uridine nucleoside N-ribohydrolase